MEVNNIMIDESGKAENNKRETKGSSSLIRMIISAKGNKQINSFKNEEASIK